MKTVSDNDKPPWVTYLPETIVTECNRVDDAPRKLVRGALLKKSQECNRNRHRRCGSSHCPCKCHDPAIPVGAA
jgi:hypothetical protein